LQLIAYEINMKRTTQYHTLGEIKEQVDYLREVGSRLHNLEERKKQLEEDLRRKETIAHLAHEMGLPKAPMKSQLGWLGAQRELNRLEQVRESLYTEFRERTHAYNLGKSPRLEEMFPSTPLAFQETRVTIEDDFMVDSLEEMLPSIPLVPRAVRVLPESDFRQSTKHPPERGYAHEGRWFAKIVAATIAVITLGSYSLSSTLGSSSYEPTNIKTVPDPWATTKKSPIQVDLPTEPTPPKENKPKWVWNQEKNKEWYSIRIGQGEVRKGTWYIPTRLEGKTAYLTIDINIEPTNDEWLRVTLPSKRSVYLPPNREGEISLLPQEVSALEEGANLEYRLVREQGNNTFYVLASGKNARLEVVHSNFNTDQVIEDPSMDLVSLLDGAIDYSSTQNEDYIKMAELYTRGMSVANLARDYHKSESTILTTLSLARNQGIKLSGHYNHKLAVVSGDVNLIINARQKGLSYRKIKEYFQEESGMSVSLSTIGRILKQYSV